MAFLCIYWRFIKAILENSKFFFIFIFIFKKQPYYVGCEASNRRNRVDTAPRRFLGLNRRGDNLYHVEGFTVVTFNVSWVNVDKGLSEPTTKAIFLLVPQWKSRDSQNYNQIFIFPKHWLQTNHLLNKDVFFDCRVLN